jgi:hypothetical protein
LDTKNIPAGSIKVPSPNKHQKEADDLFNQQNQVMMPPKIKE